jgi:hypothetical protein
MATATARPRTPSSGKAGSLFSIPLNASYQNFNGSGTEPVRYMAVTNAPPMMRLYQDNDFIFNCDYAFTSRYQGDEDYFSGNGKLYTRRIWESNFIFERAGYEALRLERARRRRRQRHARDGEQQHQEPHLGVPIGTYKKAHRTARARTCCSLAARRAFSLVWTKEDRSDMIKCDWQVGSMVVVPSDNCTHQHFNSGTTRARYLAFRPGDLGAYSPRGGGGEFADRSQKEGGWQIEYRDEDARSTRSSRRAQEERRDLQHEGLRAVVHGEGRPDERARDIAHRRFIRLRRRFYPM